MFYHPDDTICAIATAPGGAARGIVRLSGRGAGACIERCFTAEATTDVTTEVDWHGADHPIALSGRLAVAALARPLPCDLYYWPTARSYTREPVAELHTLGSPPLLQAVLRSLCAAGARLAEPGEFTLRAFLGGRLDLTQAEAVLGVIDADDGRQLDVALAQLAGGIAGPLGRLRDDLLDLLAELEAGLDFVDEDIEFITAGQLETRLQTAARAIAAIAAQMSKRDLASDLPRVVLIGEPNVGKSSLFNALLRGARACRVPALVSSRPGTTRDYLTATIDLGGVRCELIDTAGVDVEVSPEGIAGAARAVTDAQQREAHVRLLCLDATRPLGAQERSATERQHTSDEKSLKSLVVLTKIDLQPARDSDVAPIEAIETSSVTGEGLDRLCAALRAAVADASPDVGGVVAATSTRCRESLRLTTDSLERAEKVVRQGQGEELVAAEVRTALAELGKVVGAVYTDDILDRIFSRFCIGK